jgi:hypothetical protein
MPAGSTLAVAIFTSKPSSLSLKSAHENTPNQAPSRSRLSLTVERADGTVGELAEGEFRSGAGRLLFVRHGNRIEIRCPRSKELFLIHFGFVPPTGAG